MLAALTTNHVHVYDPSSFKSDILSSPLISQPIESSATSVTWAEDKSLYVAAKNKIQRFGNSGNLEESIIIDNGCVSSFLVRNNGSTIYYIADGQALCRDGGSDTILLRESPNVRWKHLVQSSDGSMLAIASAISCTILDLSLQPSQTIVLRGLTAGVTPGNPITALAFHPHMKTRLLIGTKKQILVYDVTSPSEPLKAISLGKTASGDVVGITCSPFSKTLVAIACSEGSVYLIDLENGKGKLKTIELKVLLTSAAFLKDGSAIVLGTDHGKVLVLDLRAADKPPKELVVSTQGDTVVGIAIQEKKRSRVQSTATPPITKVDELPTRKKGLAETARPLATQDMNNLRQVRRVSESSNKSLTPSSTTSSSAIQNKLPDDTDTKNTPGRKTSATLSKSRKTSSSRQIASKTAKIPLDSSTHLSDIVGVKPSKLASTAASTGASSSASSPQTPAAKKGSTILGIRPAPSRFSATPSAVTKASPTLSSSSRNTSEIGGKASRSNAGAKSRVVSGSRVIATREATPPVPALPLSIALNATTKEIVDTKGKETAQTLRARTLSLLSNSTERRGGTSRTRSQTSVRTLTPDLPSISDDSVSPLLPRQKIGSSTLNVVCSASLDMDNVTTEEGPSHTEKLQETISEEERLANMRKKRVEFVKEAEIECIRDNDVPGLAEHNEMQITPIRRRLSTNSMPMQVSPFRKFVLATSPSRGQSNNSSSVAVQELLRSVMQDVMYDFRQETRDELMGLHLDLVKMGRVWKNELRTVMDEYMGDMRNLLEENQRLREENERLMRGY